MQPQYIDTETMLFGELADELGHISEQVKILNETSGNPLERKKTPTLVMFHIYSCSTCILRVSCLIMRNFKQFGLFNDFFFL